MSIPLALDWATEPVRSPDASIRQQTIDVIRQAILNFQLRPGQRLIERELIKRLGISRTTLREALRELAAEGLVTVIPQKGARVCAPSLEEAMDLYDVRAALESIVVARFVERASDEEIQALEDTVANFRKVSSRTTDILTLLSAKGSFYAVLIRGARSNGLQQLLDGIKARAQALRAASLSRPGRAIEVAAELDGIMTAIAKRDAALASQLCAEHVRIAAQGAISSLREAEDDLSVE